MKLSEKFDKDIISRIMKDKIKPKSRWQFLLRDSFVWGVGFLSLVIGSLSFAVILYLYKFNDWNLYLQITNSFSEFILLTLPYFWLLFVFVFIFIVYYNIKHTKKGYRYPLGVILVASIILSIMLGSLFFKVGLGEAIDDVLGQKAPLYTKLFNRQLSYWSEPQKGRLSGIVVSVLTDTEFLLLDLKRNEWKIINTQSRRLPLDLIKPRMPVRLIGEIVSDDIFEAEIIIPVGPGREFFMRGGHMRMPSLNEIEEMNNMMRDNHGFIERLKEFPDILEKYPGLGDTFLDDFPGRREKIFEILKDNPEFIKNLESLGIQPDTQDELNGD